MKYIQFVFSPTGGTQKVADSITEVWNNEVQKVDLTDSDKDFSSINVQNEDLVLVAVPSFGGRVPAVAGERLARIKGNEAKCVIVCVYGNRAYEDTLIELKDTAEKSGFSVIAAIAAVAEHSIMHQYAAGRPNQEDIKILHGYSENILNKFNACDSSKAPITVPGNSTYKKAGAGGIVPKAGKNCTVCGLCTAKCPVKAIDINNPKETDSKKCISCMRCVSTCPENARKVNNALVKVAGLAMKKACLIKKECELYI